MWTKLIKLMRPNIHKILCTELEANDSGEDKKNEGHITRLDFISSRQRGCIRIFQDKI